MKENSLVRAASLPGSETLVVMPSGQRRLTCLGVVAAGMSVVNARDDRKEDVLGRRARRSLGGVVDVPV
jgi:hypothetical protein